MQAKVLKPVLLVYLVQAKVLEPVLLVYLVQAKVLEPVLLIYLVQAKVLGLVLLVYLVQAKVLEPVLLLLPQLPDGEVVVNPVIYDGMLIYLPICVSSIYLSVGRSAGHLLILSVF